jgi:hypothetical protein
VAISKGWRSRAAASGRFGGEQPTTSTCGAFQEGTATVVIPDPSVPVLNVRDNRPATSSPIPRDSQVNVVGGCGVKIAAGSWRTAAAASRPSRLVRDLARWGCVRRSGSSWRASLPAGSPHRHRRPASSPTSRSRQAAPSFTGTWNADAQGASFTFNLTQDGKSVYGNYSGSDGSNGQIRGKLKGNVLRFNWQQTDNLSGAGKFVLSADGNAFSGSYTMGNNPDVADGAWNGTRQ